MRSRCPGISSTGAMRSTAPVAMAPAGISPYCGRGAIAPLGDGQAAAFLDRFESQRAIAAGARQHDANRLLAQAVPQGVEESVDGAEQPVASFGAAFDAEMPIRSV